MESMKEPINVVARLENVMKVFFEESQRLGSERNIDILLSLAKQFNKIENPGTIDAIQMYLEIMKLLDTSIQFMSSHEHPKSAIAYLDRVKTFFINHPIDASIQNFNQTFPVNDLEKFAEYSHAYRNEKSEPDNMSIYEKIVLFCKETTIEIDHSDLPDDLKQYLHELIIQLESSIYSYKYKGKKGLDEAMNIFIAKISRTTFKYQENFSFLLNLWFKAVSAAQIVVLAGDILESPGKIYKILTNGN
jgi:hypothetical protein